MQQKTLSVDVVICGAGVLGLLLAEALGGRGMSVVLLEAACVLAGLASTRNEGWLHSSAYHAAALPTRAIAIQVAQRTRYGFEWIRQFAPEVVEEPHVRTFALIRDAQQVEEVLSRWAEACVPYWGVARQEFARLEPRVDLRRIAAIFAVEDRSIDSPLLYSKLVQQAEQYGVKIFTGTEIGAFNTDHVAALRSAAVDCPRQIAAPLFVYTAGYGTKALFRSLFDLDLPLRFWKSHLLDLPRVTTHGMFYLEPGEGTLMHHAAWSIVGLNADQVYVDEPSFVPVKENVQAVQQALQRLMPDIALAHARGRACIKVDRDPEHVDLVIGPDGHSYARPSLNVAYDEPIPGHMWALPGKMTEAPWVAQYLADLIYTRLHGRSPSLPASPSGAAPPCGRDARVALRPIDQYPLNRGVAT